MSPPATPSPSTRRKNALFCPRCGHRSPTDGDWHVRPSASGVDYVCPDCDAAVTTRPADAGRGNTPSSSHGGGWNHVRRSMALALAWQCWAVSPACLDTGR